MNTHQPYLIEEFAEDYKARRLGRRDLLRRVLLITGSIPATASILTALGCSGNDDDDTSPSQAANTAAAAGAVSAVASPGASAASGTPAGDAVQAADVRFPGQAVDVLGYMARPANQAPGSTNAGIIVIHENRGLVEHIKDVTRRYAQQGFLALAVDLMSRNGGTKPDANENAGLLGAAKIDDLVADLKSGVEYLKAQSGVRAGGVGVNGFCFGGNYTWELAIASQDIAAAVPFYGVVRSLDDLAKTRAAVLAIYGGNDTRVTGQSEQVKQRLTAAGKTVEVKVYDGADHAFFNDTGTRYNAAAATDAWARTLAWFRQYLPKA
ncbi:MAG: dienelactone hydrolase family protein [Chloroflexi bacterium]|nr:dienelactone hydrolase family protein [Chloroflexota bacterium]